MGWESVKFASPVEGPLFITRYIQGKAGVVHKSLDIGVPKGRKVFAVAKGRVNTAGTDDDYGLNIGISHGVNDGQGLQSHYAHLSEILVEVDDDVDAGQLIGKSGDSGSAENRPHLHFQMADYEPSSDTDLGPKWHKAPVKGFDFRDLLHPEVREALDRRLEKRPDEDRSADELQEKRDFSEATPAPSAEPVAVADATAPAPDPDSTTA